MAIAVMACGAEPQTATTAMVGSQAPAAAQPRGSRVQQIQAVENPVLGVVVDVAERPVARAQVTLFRRTREWPRGDRVQLHSPVWTGADGRFEFGITRTSHLELEVAAPGFATRTLLPPPQLSEYVVRLQPGFEVIGSVLDPEDAPCAGCEVFLEARVGGRMRARRAETDAKGRFEFAGVPAEALRLVARHPDFQPAILPRATVGGHRFHTLEFHDRSGLRVSGTVSDGSQRRLAEGLVRVYPNTPTGLLTLPYESRTDGEGRFRIAGLAPGSYRMEIRHPGYSSMERLLSLGRSSMTGLQMVLAHRGRLRGRLTGSPQLGGKKLSVISFLGEIATTTLRDDGSFAFPGSGFSLGLATLELEEGEVCFAASKSRWHRVPLRDDDKDHVITTIPASMLVGKVHDGHGNPLAGVQVVAPLKRFGDLGLLSARRQVVAVTDDQGCYTILGMGPGEVPLGFLKGAFAYRQESAKALPRADRIAEHLRRIIQLHRPGTIEGRVVRGGDPVRGALVMISRGMHRVRKARTDQQGRYRLGGLPPGEHQISVKFGVLPMERVPEPVKLEPGKTVTGVDVALPSRRLTGLLVDSQDAPMANLLVETPSGIVATTDINGEFKLSIPPGETWLSIRLRRGDPVTQRFVVGATEGRKKVRVQIAPRAQLRARILCMPSEQPARGVILHLDRVDQQRTERIKRDLASRIPDMLKDTWRVVERNFDRLERYERRTVERWVELEEGLLELNNLPNRTMRLTIRAKGYVPHVETVELHNGKPVNLGEIRLRRGSRIHGLVVDSWGKPLAGARVVLGRESELANPEARTIYLTDENGRFMARGVALSNRRLYVAADGFATGLHDLRLPKDTLRRQRNPVRIQMQTGATIQVRVVEDKVRQPLGYVMVRLHRGGELIARQRTDEDGRVAFTHLGKDDYQVSVQGWPRKLGLSVTSTSGNKAIRREIVVRD